ncbi:MAG: response regulator, partial [Bryobacteraceae bacterium]
MKFETMPKPPKSAAILLVEDNAADVLLVREALQTCSIAVELTVASDGERALYLLVEKRQAFDLVMLDLNIPKIDGLTVLERFSPKSAPVVLFSSSCMTPDVQRAYRLGADDCVRKPLDLQDFMNEVCRIVEHWTAPVDRPPVLTPGPYFTHSAGQDRRYRLKNCSARNFQLGEALRSCEKIKT